MDQRQFFATVVVVILLGISVAVGVNMLVGDATTEMQIDPVVDQSQEVSMNFESIDVIWNTFPTLTREF
jgi:hypothetical protein